MSGTIVFKTIVILLAGFAALAWSRPDLVGSFLPPCRAPIEYSLGAFDYRFGISEAEFLSAIADAEALWERPVGKELFVHAPEKGRLSINLVYDERQETTNILGGLEKTLEENEAAYRVLQSRHASMKLEYDRASASYEARVASFNERNRAYGRRVDAWNRGPRTSQAELSGLESERLALDRELAEVKRAETELNRIVRDLNELVGSLNRAAETLNRSVGQYNAAGSSRGETFTGGTYYESGRERKIDIYEFATREKLVRILAHELGHALGLEHTDDSTGIMYYLNDGTSPVLSESDSYAVRALCGAL